MLFADELGGFDPFLKYGSFGLLAFIVFWAVYKFFPSALDKHEKIITKVADDNKAAVALLVDTFKAESAECREERIKQAEASAAERLREQQARHDAMNRVTASNAELHKIIADLQRAVLELQGRERN